MSKTIKAHSIWISDIHFGSYGTQIDRLKSFIETISCQNLFINGDIFDKYIYRNSHNFPKKVTDIIDRIILLNQSNVNIFILSGNHDCREHLKNVFVGLKIYNEYIYISKKEKRFLVTHGHEQDPSVAFKHVKLAKFGTSLYEFLLKRRKKTKGTSISRFVKVSVKKTISFLFRYQNAIFKYINNRDLDGIIYGHTHQPIIEDYKSKKFINSGDWIDNCSYIVETETGEFLLKKW